MESSDFEIPSSTPWMASSGHLGYSLPNSCSLKIWALCWEAMEWAERERWSSALQAAGQQAQGEPSELGCSLRLSSSSHTTRARGHSEHLPTTFTLPKSVRVR